MVINNIRPIVISSAEQKQLLDQCGPELKRFSELLSSASVGVFKAACEAHLSSVDTAELTSMVLRKQVAENPLLRDSLFKIAKHLSPRLLDEFHAAEL